MTLLAIDWAGVGIQTVYFILAFSILVVLHEFGHFLPAKWFKCRVEKFYLFFNPWFSLVKKKIGETEWGLGWVPFGGYVKISGMVDESMDKEQLKLPPQPYEFRAKPAWQRLIIMLGGVTVNVILAIVIFVFILWIWGEQYVPPQNAKNGIVADSLARSIGLQDGDIVTKYDNNPVKDEMKIAGIIVSRDPKTITVNRNGSDTVLNIPSDLVGKLNSRKYSFTSLRFEGIISKFAGSSNAKDAGLMVGDRFFAVDSVATPFSNDVQREVKAKKNSTVNITVNRNGQPVTVPVKVTEEGTIGIGFQTEVSKLGFKVDTIHYSFLEAIPAGWNKCWSTLDMYITGIKQIFTGKVKASESLGSVISIGSIFPDEWGEWQAFWTLTAIFSIVLAFMNVLPIPALDGGHALFTIYEMITGRKPGDKFMERAQMVGMVLLLGLMAYALGLDFLRVFRNLF